jgi:acetylornithine deacetylase/succinyl-diaminopimelate desuccinylase-like protein
MGNGPFELTVDDKGRMYGRGSTDDKGPVLGWLNVIEAHQKAGVEFPVNLLMCFEGMEEYGSEGLDDFIEAEVRSFSRMRMQYAYRTIIGWARKALLDLRSARM